MPSSASVLAPDPVFKALTRPQMFAGVTYSFFVLNFILCTEGFLLLRSGWVVALALAVHLAGVVACWREPRIFELWQVRLRHCPRVRNHRYWGCNSYLA
jgi:type IV secretion system protein VirB3